MICGVSCQVEDRIALRINNFHWGWVIYRHWYRVSIGSRNGDDVRRLYMDLAMISPAHPNMLLWGQLRRCKARWMWCLKLRKFVKIGQGAREGGFATSAAASSYEIVLSILTWDRMHWGAILLSFVFAKNC